MKKTILCLLLSCLLLAGCSQPVSLTNATINMKGELVLSYSDGSSHNLGVVVGQDGKDGADGKDGLDGAGGTAAPDNASAIATGLRSAVSIFCTHTGRQDGTPYYSAGSGVIYRLDKEQGDAFIITNYHVVYDKAARTPNGIAEEITLYLYGSHLEDYAITATYVGGSQNYDIAILRVEDSDVLKNSSAQSVTVADSNAVRVGSTAIAIGNPENGGISATCGIVSVDSEHITVTASDDVTKVDYRVMRIDTAVNPGNSGGGLFDHRGRLIGIVNAKTINEGVESIGYALPSSTVIPVADNIIDHCFGTKCENVRRPIMGVTITTGTSSAVYENGAVSIRETVVIHEVTPGQIGASFRVGDVLLSVTLGDRTQEITRQHHVIDFMLTARPGDTVTFQILRNDQPKTITVTVTEKCMTDY